MWVRIRPMKFSLDFIHGAVSGDLKSSPVSGFLDFSTDHRELDLKGKIFIPLVGKKQDAHQYVTAAIKRGATGALIHSWDPQWEPLKEKASFILVPDTLKALQALAKAWRKTFKGKVLGLTGSNGKTTTKDFLFQILQNFGTTHCSHRSFNNHYGVPFTLLKAPPETSYVIVEIGMNHAGEVSQLTGLADPDLVMVTNVGRAHMGNFADGIKGVAKAKEEIYEAAKPTAQLLFNIDNEWTRKMYQTHMDRPSYSFSTQNFSADVFFRIKSKRGEELEVEGQIGGVLGKTHLSFWGDHNVENLAAAVNMAYIAGCPPQKLWKVLDQCHCGWGRHQWLKIQKGARILFDGYNANPDSFAQLLKTVTPLVSETKKGVAIFGEMLELGPQTEAMHEELGEKAGHLPWQKAIFIGPSAKAFGVGWERSGNKNKPIIFKSYEDSLDFDFLSMVEPGSVIVVKGSRGGALERIVERLTGRSHKL